MLVAGTDDGDWRSGDGAVHWTRAGTGLRGNAIVSLAAAGRLRGLAGAVAGLLRH